MSAFVKMLDEVRQHNFGGTSVNIACEPYISGYGFIKWYLPPVANLQPYFTSLKIEDSTHQTGSAETQINAEKYLSAACIGVTPPSQTLTGIEYDAAAGIKLSNVTKVSNGYNLNIKYLEMSGIPIFRIHKAWIEYIRDAKSGYKVNMHYGGKENQKDDYCGNVLYWTTKPDGRTVEFFALYSGIYPLVDPQDAFGFDIGSIDKVELDFSYHVDYIWTDPWVKELAEGFAKSKPYGNKDSTTWSGYTGRWGSENKRGGHEKSIVNNTTTENDNRTNNKSTSSTTSNSNNKNTSDSEDLYKFNFWTDVQAMLKKRGNYSAAGILDTAVQHEKTTYV